MAYWLGFLFADGSVQEMGSNYQIALKLKCIDHSHVEKYKNALMSGYHLGLCKNKENCSVSHTIYDNILAMDLIQLGCIPRKSLKLEWPRDIPDEYVHHFVRGYFDGDGSISFSKGNKVLDVSFYGTSNFITYLQLYLKEKVLYSHVAKGGIYANKNIIQLRYGGVSSTLAVLNWIYKDSDSSTRLDRKYALYMKFREISDLKPQARSDEMIKFISSKEYNILLHCQLEHCCPQLLIGPAKSKRRDYQFTKIVQMDKNDGSIIKVWKNASTVDRELEYLSSNILKACRGEMKTSYGYVWKFENNSSL
eukprot:432095_1